MRCAPAWPDDIETAVMPLSGGLRGVRETVALMRAMVDAYRLHPGMRELATQAIFLTPPKDDAHECRALYELVRDNVRYTRDVAGVETLHTPDRVWQLRLGDCDDMSTLLATLFEAVGYQTRFVCVGYEDPSRVDHVYVQVLCGGEWVGADPTEWQGFGWEPPPAPAFLVEVR